MGVDRIWAMLNLGRERPVPFARARLLRQWGQHGIPRDEAQARASTALDAQLLTIGFARRAASYKRLTLFLREPERLRRLLLDPERPIQLVRIVFLEDYDVQVTGRLVQGVDVWLNTPAVRWRRAAPTT